jgi:hypothetical protein
MEDARTGRNIPLRNQEQVLRIQDFCICYSIFRDESQGNKAMFLRFECGSGIFGLERLRSHPVCGKPEIMNMLNQPTCPPVDCA